MDETGATRTNGEKTELGGNVELGAGWRRLKWIGAAIGIGFAFPDTLTLRWLGTTLMLGGRDVTLPVAAWFGMSFAFLGFLLGDAIAARRRHQLAADIIRAQVDAINKSRAHL